jgi:hypothetical protein
MIVLALAAVILFGIWRPLSESLIEPAITPTAVAFILPTLVVLSDMTCSDAPPTRLQSGMEAHVARAGEGNGVRRNLFVRDRPNGERVGIMEPGTNFRITGDSVCGDAGQRWWPIETDDLSGWSVEGFPPADYLMVPGPV